MIKVRISKEDERCARGAETLQELQGLKALLLERIDQAEALNEFRKANKAKVMAGPRAAPPYHWSHALVTAREVLGNDAVTVPPYPMREWVVKINAHMKQYGLGEPEVRRLAEYVRDNMKTPIKLDFMIRQHERILNGEWVSSPSKQIRLGATGRINIYANQMPDD